MTVTIPAPAVGSAAVASRTQTAAARALVTDPITGTGGTVEVVVQAHRGAGGVHTDQPLAPDTARAAQVAVAAALGEQADRWRLTWELRGVPFPLAGGSLGLALALAARAAVEDRALPPGWAFTGAVDLDGRISAVSAVPAKLRAAADAGCQCVGLPAEQADRDAPLAVRGFATLAEARAALLPPRRTRRLTAALITLVLLPLLAGLGATERLDLRGWYWLLRLAHGELPATQSVLVPIPRDTPLAERRAGYGPLVRALAARGAGAIALDLSLTDDPSVYEDLALATGQAQDQGVPVLVGVRWGPEGPVAPSHPALAASTTWGLAAFETEAHRAWVLGRAPVTLLAPDGQHVWHLAIAAHHARTPRIPGPTLDGQTLQAGGGTHPIAAGRVLMHPVADSPSLDWQAPETWPELAGRVAVVGTLRQDAALETPDGLSADLQLHAALVETLAAGQAPSRAGRLADLVTTALAGWGLVLLGLTRWRALAGAIPALVLATVLVRAQGGALMAVVPPLLAIAAGAAALGPLRLWFSGSGSAVSRRPG